MIKQIIVTIGGKAEDLGGKSISDLVKYSQPLVKNLVEKINGGSLVIIYEENDETITASDEDGNPITFEDITEAYENGKSIKAKFESDGTMIFELMYISNAYVVFENIDSFMAPTRVSINGISHSNEDLIEVVHREIEPME
jgi:hypothetical protein